MMKIFKLGSYLLAVLLFTSCGSSVITRDTMVVETVTQAVFDWQEEDLNALDTFFSSPKTASDSTLGIRSEKAVPRTEKVSLCFTDAGLEAFLGERYLLKTALMAAELDYTLNVNKIIVTPDPKDADYYSFSCEVLLTAPDGSTTAIGEQGTCLFSEKDAPRAIKDFWMTEKAVDALRKLL